MEAKDYDKTLDLTKIKPYGDTMNDGKMQLSFGQNAAEEDGIGKPQRGVLQGTDARFHLRQLLR